MTIFTGTILNTFGRPHIPEFFQDLRSFFNSRTKKQRFEDVVWLEASSGEAIIVEIEKIIEKYTN